MLIVSGQWRDGYLVISIIQGALVLILLFSQPLWHKRPNDSNEPLKKKDLDNSGNKAKITVWKSGLTLSLMSFFFYCGVESTVGLWGSSFLSEIKGMTSAQAAQLVSFYWGGITAGRFISGFISFRLNNKQLIRLGQFVALGGTVLLALPLPTIFTIASFMLIGLGLAPIFPGMLHETPARFGRTGSQMIMGFQMAVAYTGATLLPPLLGSAASRTSLTIFPVATLIYTIIMLLSSESLMKLLARKKAETEEAAK
jgi:fucose permease